MRSKSIWTVFVSNIVLLSVTYALFETKCFSTTCSAVFRDGFLVPFFWLFLMSVPLVGLFLFFPEQIFRSWLRKIAWWYMIGLTVIVAMTPVFSSNILSLDRSQVVFGGMALLLCITIPYAVIARKRLQTGM